MANESTGRSRGLLAAGAVLTIATAALFLRNLHKQKTRPPRRKPDAIVPSELLKMFEAAAEDSKQLIQISNTERLILYSLYKQSKEGDAPDESPGILAGVVEEAKYSAWSRVRGMSTAQAMVHYVEAVQQLRIHGSVDHEGFDEEGAEDVLNDLGGSMGNKASSLANRPEDDGDGYQGQDLTPAQKLLRAAGQNNVKEIKSILAKNPDLVNHRDEDGQSALHLAADKGAADALNVLMEAGADGNAADGDGITVLQAAVIADNVEACRVLLSHGANPDQTDVDGDTPRKCAEEDGSDEMRQLFSSY